MFNTSELIPKEQSASEAQVDLKLLGKSALPPGSDIVLTLGLFPAHRTDVEKGQDELDSAKRAAQKMEDRNEEGALKRLRAVTDMISGLQSKLSEVSKVRGDIFYFALYLMIYPDSSSRYSCLEDCVRGGRRERIHMFDDQFAKADTMFRSLTSNLRGTIISSSYHLSWKKRTLMSRRYKRWIPPRSSWRLTSASGYLASLWDTTLAESKCPRCTGYLRMYA